MHHKCMLNMNLDLTQVYLIFLGLGLLAFHDPISLLGLGFTTAQMKSKNVLQRNLFNLKLL